MNAFFILKYSIFKILQFCACFVKCCLCNFGKDKDIIIFGLRKYENKPEKQEKEKENMEEKRYLKWYNKVGYGSGDVAGNVVYAFLSTFVMLYLTNTVGLNPGIVGTLIAVSKLFDGVTDIFFGSMIDKTKTKMGKQNLGCCMVISAVQLL